MMETIWVDLSAEGSGFEPSAWHGDVLKERKARYDAGELKASDWDKAKARIRKSLS